MTKPFSDRTRSGLLSLPGTHGRYKHRRRTPRPGLFPFGIASLPATADRPTITTFVTGLFVSLSAFLFLAETRADDHYSATIEPLLRQHCVACHNPDTTEGGLDLSTYEGLLRGGVTGPALTAGAMASSRMYLMASGTLEPAMPPDPSERLSENQLKVLGDWIQTGAVGPQGSATVPTLRVPSVAVRHHRPSPITAMAFDATGDLAAFGITGGFVLLPTQRLQAGKLLATHASVGGLLVTGLPGKVNSLQFSADGQTLWMAGGVAGLQGSAYGVALEPVRTQLAGLETLTPVTFADLSVQTFTGHRDALYAAVPSPDGQWLATAGYDRQIRLWRIATGEVQTTLGGHNGAVYDLAFSPDSSILWSASADQTVKVWDVATGNRLDTLGQPEGEVFALHLLDRNSAPEPSLQVLAIGADNRLRVWQSQASAAGRSHSLVETRFVDETPLLAVAVDSTGKRVAVAAQSGGIKWLARETWDVMGAAEPIAGTPSAIAFAADGRLWIADLDGQLHQRQLASETTVQETDAAVEAAAIYLPPTALPTFTIEELPLEDGDDGRRLAGPSLVRGTLTRTHQVDLFHWVAQAGEVWAIDVDPVALTGEVSSVHPSLTAGGTASPLDPLVTILDQAGQPVLRTRLQAVRESYFTFRGKDSQQSDDFRLFGQQDMRLDQYLYASGEVTRLWMHPRGPDSGFDVYPGQGARWTYFGTSHVTHALGEPAYIVQPLAPGQPRLDNGLPVFDVVYRNDDDPSRQAGQGSRITFRAPAAGTYTIAVQDARGQGGVDYHYQLRLRAAQPDFQASVTAVSQGLWVGAGREFTVSVDRFDEFDGPVAFSVTGLPPGVQVSSPLIIEAGQRSAQGTIWMSEAVAWPETVEPQLSASAQVLGQTVTRNAGSLGVLKQAEKPGLIPTIVVSASAMAAEQAEPGTVIRLKRGETVAARVQVQRPDGLDGEISFGNALAARNPAHGVYVDNIGLNGLLLLAGMNEREFFLTAEPKTALGKRPFFLKAEIDGGVTTLPIWVEVVADEVPTRATMTVGAAATNE